MESSVTLQFFQKKLETRFHASNFVRFFTFPIFRCSTASALFISLHIFEMEVTAVGAFTVRGNYISVGYNGTSRSTVSAIHPTAYTLFSFLFEYHTLLHQPQTSSEIQIAHLFSSTGMDLENSSCLYFISSTPFCQQLFFDSHSSHSAVAVAATVAPQEKKEKTKKKKREKERERKNQRKINKKS